MYKKLTQENRNLIVRRIVFALALVCIAALQNTDGLIFSPFGITPMLLIPAVVCIAMFERDTVGMFYGLFAGLMWDSVSAEGGSFNALLLTAIGFACGALIKRIMRNNLITALLLCSAATVLHQLVYWLRIYIIGGNIDGALSLFTFYLPSCIYTILLLPLFYFPTRAEMKKRG